jgi:serine/threonine protein kinase
MSADNPLDPFVEALSNGDPVDWTLAESATDLHGGALRALKDIERIAGFSRRLQRVDPAKLPMNAPTASVAGNEPERWGDLVLIERIGAGAMGEVWRAWDSTLQRQVALKFLQRSDTNRETGSNLLREARALARIRHPSVVVVHGIAEHNFRVGMWMEYLDGATLASEIERLGALPSREVARIGLDLCSALETLESVGLVHRDIKPANIILEPGGRVVMTDFGLGWSPRLEDGGAGCRHAHLHGARASREGDSA